MKGLDVMKILLALIVSFVCGYAFAEEKPVLSKERVVFHTNRGDIVVALYPEVAPKHARQILRMAEAGVFDGIDFYRLEPGFVLQISNHGNKRAPLTAEQETVVENIPAEFSAIKHRRGHLSMARFDDPNSADSSFSFMLGAADHLDGKYTVFGEIVHGLDVLSALERVGSDTSNRPLEDLIVKKATVAPDGNLSGIQLEGPTHPQQAYDPYHDFLKLFAGVAFLGIVGWPFFNSFFKTARKLIATGGK